MSLVNDMLQDLQERRDSARSRPLAGLRAAPTTRAATTLRIGTGWLWALLPLMGASAAMLWWSVREQPAVPQQFVEHMAPEVARLSVAALNVAAPEVAAPDAAMDQSTSSPDPALTEERVVVPDASSAVAAPAPPDPGRVAQLASLTRYTYALDLRLRHPVVRAERRQPIGGVVAAPVVIGPAVTAAATEAPAGPVVSPKRPARPSANALREQGVSALRASRPVVAERHFREMLRLYPGLADGYLLVHAALSAQRRGAAAEAVLRDGLLAVDPDARIALALARDLVDRGDNAAALEVLLGARRTGAADPVYEAFVAAVLQRAGRHAEAAGVYRVLLENDAANGAWWTGLGISEEAAGNATAALAAFRSASRSPGLPASLAEYATQRAAALDGEGG